MKRVLVSVIPVMHPTVAKENLMILFSTLSNSLMKTFHPSTKKPLTDSYVSFTEISVNDRFHIDLFRIFCKYQFADQYLFCVVEHFLFAGRKPLFLSFS